MALARAPAEPPLDDDPQPGLADVEVGS
jgi:hypothetical protein